MGLAKCLDSWPSTILARSVTKFGGRGDLLHGNPGVVTPTRWRRCARSTDWRHITRFANLSL